MTRSADRLLMECLRVFETHKNRAQVCCDCEADCVDADCETACDDADRNAVCVSAGF